MGTNGGLIEGVRLNIGDGNFVVNSSGNVTMAGNINLSNGNITWGNNGPVKYQFSTDISGPWHNAMRTNDKYRRDSLDGGTTWSSGYQFRGEDATVTRANIVRAMLDNIDEDGLYTTYVNGKQCLGINATAIKTGVLEAINIHGCDIYGGSFYDENGKTRLVLNPSGSSGHYGDFALYGAGGKTPVFSIYDNIGSASLSAYGVKFLTAGAVGSISVYAHGNWNFGNANVTGITACFA